MDKQRPILITGGHMTPALAIQSRLREEGFSNFIWIGHKYNQTHATTTSPEYKTVKAMPDTRFIDLPAGKLVRSWHKSFEQLVLAVKNLLKIPYGFILAFWIILRNRPLIVASFGGYLGLPVVISAWMLRIPAITHEQTVVSGLANRMIAKFVNKIFISWPDSASYYPADKTILSGNPIRPEVFMQQSNLLNFDSYKLPTIYITCGNQGAVVINRAVLAALPDLLTRANIIHQTGSAEATKLLLEELVIPLELKPRYFQKDFFFANEVGEAFAKADFVIARAGANTVTELLALGKPALLIPIPWVTQNEQFKNAKYLEDLGIAHILPQQELTAETLLSSVDSLLSILHSEELSQSIQAAQKSYPKDAANIIVKNMLNLV